MKLNTALLVGRSRDRFPVMSLGIFSVVPPTEQCALRSTQPLKVSTRDFSWGKGDWCVWLTTYHPCSAETSRKSGALIYPELLGIPRPVAGDLYFLYETQNILSLYLLSFLVGLRAYQHPCILQSVHNVVYDAYYVTRSALRIKRE